MGYDYVRMMKMIYLMASIFLFQSSAFAEVQPKASKFRTTFEEITLPQGEKMGLQGFSLLYDINSYLSIGGSAYGALTGQRGGFITLGLAADIDIPLADDLTLNTGVFVGGGGGRGGFTIQGGGLQVRTHLGLAYTLEDFGALAVGASYQDFPNGSIHSFQPYLGLDYTFDTLMLDGWADVSHEKVEHDDGMPTEFAVAYRRYHVPSGVLNDELKPQYPRVDILGVEWRRFVAQNTFIKIETEGALGGDSHGFMQIMFGGGYALNITSSTKLKLSAAAGVAGGGKLSTAGGLLLSVDTSVQQMLGDDLFAELGVGYVIAPDGDFKAMSTQLYVGSYFEMPKSMATLGAYNQHKIRIRFVHQTYTPNDPKWRNHHADLNVQLIGFQNDYFIADNVYLTGQGITAYGGQGGNYMTGLIGAGLHYNWAETDFYTDWEALVGAAGGGGLDVGGGLVWQSNINLGYELNESNFIAMSYGQMQAPKGNFKAHVFGASISYNFSLFAK
jgi:hypothetical protein